MIDSKYDPYDVDALEKSLNDSATRVSNIWISFLLFSLYLLTAVGAVTHRQLFLDGPITLPVLNIQLPLWGFFFLAPILFLIFHVYVLLQLQLLGRTARAYDEALDRAIEDPGSNAVMRQRLANTLFAQIFAGAPSEREGWFGALLKAIAWITMALAPILILLAFQFAFLPYHSHLATWLHRVLIAIEIAVFMLVWPRVWSRGANVARPRSPGFLERWRIHTKGRRWSFRPGLAAMILLYVTVCLSIGSFPGEPHVNLVTGRPLTSVECDRWLHRHFDLADLRFDRLVPTNTFFVDDETISKIKKAIAEQGAQPWNGKPALNLERRDLNCSQLARADLRHANLKSANLLGAWVFFSDLRASDLADANLDGASLIGTDFGDADVSRARFRGAELRGAGFQGAWLYQTQLQGADISFARFQGASLESADLQGTHADPIIQFQAAHLLNVDFQGAQLVDAQFQGARLIDVLLRGSSLKGASFQSAYLSGVQLQGTDLADSTFDHAVLSDIWVWRAANADCAATRIMQLHSDKPRTLVTAADVSDYIAHVAREIPATAGKDAVAERMHRIFDINAAGDDAETIAANWAACQQSSSKIPQDVFDAERAELLRSLVCDSIGSEREAVTKGVLNWIRGESISLSSNLARGLLGEDGKECVGAKHFDESSRDVLRKAAARGRTAKPPESPAKP